MVTHLSVVPVRFDRSDSEKGYVIVSVGGPTYTKRVGPAMRIPGKTGTPKSFSSAKGGLIGPVGRLAATYGFRVVPFPRFEIAPSSPFSRHRPPFDSRGRVRVGSQRSRLVSEA